MTCSDAYALTDCSCGFAEELFDAGRIQCSDVQFCPADCPVCKTCLDLLCGVPGKSPIRVRPMYWLYVVIGACALFVTCLCCYYSRRYQANRDNDLRNSLLHKAVSADKHRVAPLLVTPKGTSTFQPPVPLPVPKKLDSKSSEDEEEESVAGSAGSTDATAPTVDETTVLVGEGSIVTAPTVATREESTLEETSTQRDVETKPDLESSIPEDTEPEATTSDETSSPEDVVVHGSDNVSSATIASVDAEEEKVLFTEKDDDKERSLPEQETTEVDPNLVVDTATTPNPDLEAGEATAPITSDSVGVVQDVTMEISAIEPDGEELTTPFVGDIDETANSVENSETGDVGMLPEEPPATVADDTDSKKASSADKGKDIDPSAISKNQEDPPTEDPPEEKLSEPNMAKDTTADFYFDTILQKASEDEEEEEGEATNDKEASSNKGEVSDEVSGVSREENVMQDGTLLMADTTIMADDSLAEEGGDADPEEEPELANQSLIDIEDLD